MIKRKVHLVLIVCLILPLSGCWDQKPLKDAHLVYSMGYELDKNEQLMQTIEIVRRSAPNQPSFQSEVHSATGHTPSNINDTLRKNISGNIRYFNQDIELFEDALAKKGIFPYLLDVFRVPDDSTAELHFISVDGKPSKILEKKRVENLFIGEFLNRKIKNLQKRSVFPPETAEIIFRKLFDPGEDFVLPSIKLKGKEVVANGLALFHNDRLTGKIPLDQSVLFVLLSKKMGQTANITRKLPKEDWFDSSEYVTIEMNKRQVKRKMKVVTDKKGTVHVKLKLQLQTTLIEDTGNFSYNKKGKDKLNNQLSQELTKEAKKITKILQEANCDAFGVGRQLMAYHPDVWKKKNWTKEYSKVKFHPEVEVEILDNGSVRPSKNIME